MLKICLAGVGGISGAHIPAWERMTDAELTGLCDIRPERLALYPDKHGYADFDEMLEKEKPDILDICLPTYLHAEYAIRAMKKGIHVICEKPISLRTEDVKRIYDAAAENHVNFMVAHVLRFWPEYELIREIRDDGRYGKLLSGNMQRFSAIPVWSYQGWMQDEARSGLVPFDLHIHDLDFLIYLLGAPTSVRQSRVKRPDQDGFAVLYDFGDIFVSCESAWYGGRIPFQAEYRFQFEKAVVVYRSGKLTVYQDDETVITPFEQAGGELGTLDLPGTDAYENEIIYFADCVRKGVFPDKVKAEEMETVVRTLLSLNP